MTDGDKLRQLIEAPEFDGSAADGAELAVALTGRVEIAGREMPAPSAAVIALLDALESPFVAEDAGEATLLDIFRALYVIGARDQVALPVLRLMRKRAALDKLREDSEDDGDQGETGRLLAASSHQAVADAEAEFDAAALAYGEGLGCFPPADAARDIGEYLAMATGWSMLPQMQGDTKKKPGTVSIS